MLTGKRAAVFGVANERSLAWHIAKAFSEAGARVAVGYQDERLGRWVTPLVETLRDGLALPCDACREEEMDQAFRALEERFSGLDILVHSLAFADKESLSGRFLDTSRQGFLTAMEASVYSFIALARRAQPLMEKTGGGSILTLTFMGSHHPVPHYNVMGPAKAALESSVLYLAHELGPSQIRVNAISAGPVSTLAARGIPGFTGSLKMAGERSALRRNISGEDVAGAAVFLASDAACSITGEILYVDAGLRLAS